MCATAPLAVSPYVLQHRVRVKLCLLKSGIHRGLVSPGMATASGLLKQIQSCTDFFLSQSALGLSVDSVVTCMASMAASVTSQINSMGRIDVAECAALNAAIGSSGFSAEHKRQIAEAVTAIAGAVPGANIKAHMQTMSCSYNFFTVSDWDTFHASSHLSAKVHKLVERCVSLRLVHPSETTIRGLVATLAVAHCPDGDGRQLHSLVVDVKRAFHHLRVGKAPGMINFPAMPIELPSDTYKAAYTDIDPPSCRSLAGWSVIYNRVPLRQTNRALQLGGSQASAASDPMAMLRTMLQQCSGQQPRGPRLSWIRGASAISDDSFGTPPPVHRLHHGVSPEQLVLMPPPQSPEVASPASASSPPTTLAVAVAPAVAASSGPVAAVAAAPPVAVGSSLAAAADDDHDDDVVSRLETLAAKVVKRPAAATDGGCTGSAAASPSAPPMKRPAAAKVAPHSVLLGCGKCRGLPLGCTQCQDPAFTGKRWQDKAKVAKLRSKGVL